MSSRTNESDVERVLGRLREAHKFMPYLHESVPYHALRKVVDDDEDRARWALHILCTRGLAEYLTHCSPDHYRAFAVVEPPSPGLDDWMINRMLKGQVGRDGARH